MTQNPNFPALSSQLGFRYSLQVIILGGLQMIETVQTCAIFVKLFLEITSKLTFPSTVVLGKRLDDYFINAVTDFLVVFQTRITISPSHENFGL